MQDNQITSMREVLEKMPTDQLDSLLNAELEKDPPDANAVRLILHVLWEREKDMPVEVSPGVQRAWEKYQKDTALLDMEKRRPRRLRRWLVRVASVAAVICILYLAIPQDAGADNLFEKLTRLTDSIVEFFSPGMANDNLAQYEFTTDNPGLQQVYDTVVRLGVTEPVVPMWLPEGYELTECKVVETSHKAGLFSSFGDGERNIVFCVDVHSLEVSHEYHWDGELISDYESYGGNHAVMRNNDRWVVSWYLENIECFLTLDCQEDTLYRILDSIYVMEDK